MSDSGGDGLDGLAALAILLTIGVFIGAIWLAVKLCEYCVEHSEEIAQFLLILARWAALVLWAPFAAVAWLVLFLSRDLVIIKWPRHFGEENEQKAIVIWTVFLPILLAEIWFLSVTWLTNSLEHEFVLGIAIGIVAAAVETGTYYFLYFHYPPKHHNWPLFLASEERLLADTRLMWIQRKAKFRLWWLSRRNTKQAGSGGH